MKSNRFLAAGLLAASAWTASWESGAQSARLAPLPLEIACGVKELDYRFEVSADGAFAAYMVVDWSKQKPWPKGSGGTFTATGANQDGAAHSLRVRDLRTGKETNFDDGDAVSWAPVWSPDGKQLAFYSDRDGAARLWLWDSASGKVRRLTAAIVRPGQTQNAADRPIWVAGGTAIVTKLLPQGVTLEEALQMEKPPEPADLGKTDALTVMTYHSDVLPQKNWTNFLWADVGVVDIAGGSVRRFITRRPVGALFVAPDGQTAAVNFWDRPTQGLTSGDIAVVSVQTGERLWGLDNEAASWSDVYQWSADGRYLSFVTKKGLEPRILDARSHKELPQSFKSAFLWRWLPDGGSYYAVDDKNDAWRVPADGRGRAVRLQRPKNTALMYEVSTLPADGRSFLGVEQDGNTTRYVVFDAQSGKKMADLWSYTSAGHVSSVQSIPGTRDLLFVSAVPYRFPELWRYRNTAGDTEQLTRLNPEYDSYAMGKAMTVEWNYPRGKLQGTLLLPAGYTSGKRYPVVVDVYGTNSGPPRDTPGAEVHIQPAGKASGHDTQVLATRGYAVFWASTAPRKGTPMKDIYESAMAGVDKLIEMGIADPDRLALSGESHGGYAVRSMIVQTDRFKAAISSVGMGGNLLSMYSKMSADSSADGALWLENWYMSADPWKAPDEWRENSPFFLYDKIKTPILIQVGMNDEIGMQGYDTFVAARRLGFKAELALYHGEQHWIVGYRNCIDFWQRRLAFLGKYLNLTGNFTEGVPHDTK